MNRFSQENDSMPYRESSNGNGPVQNNTLHQVFGQVEVESANLEPNGVKSSESGPVSNPVPKESHQEVIDAGCEERKHLSLRRFKPGQVCHGTVKEVVKHGASVEIEEGINGFLRVNEMSWTRINHPNEILSVGDEIEVVVLGIKKKRSISLSLKRLTADPWKNIERKYPEGSVITGTIRNLARYGAFVEIEKDINGLLHNNEMSWGRKVTNPNQVVTMGQTVQCKLLSIDKRKRRIALSLRRLSSDPWETRIPNEYQPGQLVKGTVTRIVKFGVFVRLEDDLEGLLHVSELSDHKIESPEEIVNIGDEIEVEVLRVDCQGRKIGLSLRYVSRI